MSHQGHTPLETLCAACAVLFSHSYPFLLVFEGRAHISLRPLLRLQPGKLQLPASLQSHLNSPWTLSASKLGQLGKFYLIGVGWAWFIYCLIKCNILDKVPYWHCSKLKTLLWTNTVITQAKLSSEGNFARERTAAFERAICLNNLNCSVWKTILGWKDEVCLHILPVAPLLRLPAMTVLLLQTPVWKKKAFFFLKDRWPFMVVQGCICIWTCDP